MTGRPSEFTDAIGVRICELVADGALIQDVCEQVAEEQGRDAPLSPGTLARWLDTYPSFREAYARASEIGFDVRAQGLLRVPLEEQDVQRARLISENTKWLLSKVASRKYGDRIDVNVTNQVSITDALAAARARHEALEARPIRDQLPQDETQVIDLPSQSIAGPPDSESDPDPFS